MKPTKKIGIQGFEGSFHQIAAEGFFHNHHVEVLPCKSFSDLTSLCSQSERADAGVMAIENSIAGSILPNYNLLQEANLHIVGEVYLQISQNLMGLKGQQLEDIKEVHSHPMAINQCRSFLKEYPHILIVETIDTALSGKNISRNKWKNIATIASKRTAEIYNLEIIKPNIETVRNNYTRFLILEREENKWSENANKASIYFGVNHKPGSLAKILTVLADKEVNLSKIQSFPIIKKEWQYYFHLDIEFSSINNYNEVIKNIKILSEELRILGVYEKGKTI